MELMGSTLTSAYARPRTGHFLPAITSGAGSRSLWRSSDLRRSSGATTSLALVPADNLDLVRAKTMFYPTARTVLSTRYSPDDWHRSNQNSYSQSESSRKSAERLRRDTVRLIQDRNQLTRRSQESSSRDIGQRLNNIVFWTSELKHEIDNMVTETAALAEVKRRLERALAETEGPFQVRGGRGGGNVTLGTPCGDKVLGLVAAASLWNQEPLRETFHHKGFLIGMYQHLSRGWGGVSGPAQVSGPDPPSSSSRSADVTLRSCDSGSSLGVLQETGEAAGSRDDLFRTKRTPQIRCKPNVKLV